MSFILEKKIIGSFFSFFKQATGKCKAVFDFEGQGDNELSFAPGDMIDTLEEVDADWMRGRIGMREGIFPKSFVEVISEIPSSSQIRKISQAKPTTPGRDSNGEALVEGPRVDVVVLHSIKQHL